VGDGDHFVLKANGPGGGKSSSSSEEEKQDTEVVWQQDLSDDWKQLPEERESDEDWILRPADLTLEKSIQELEEISEMEMWEASHRSLPVPTTTRRFQKVTVIKMTSWGELTHSEEYRRYHRPKKVVLTRRRLQKLDGILEITKERPKPERFKRLIDESAFPKVIQGLGDKPKDRTSSLEIPIPISVRVKCRGEVRRMAGHWVQDITDTLTKMGKLTGEFKIWVDQGQGHKFDRLRRGMFLEYISNEEEEAGVRHCAGQGSVRIEEEDQTWYDSPEVVLNYILSLVQFRRNKEIIITRNHRIWQLGEEISEGDHIRVTTAGGGGMLHGGLVGWQEGPEPMEWITILEAQVRLGQRNQARQDRLIMIWRNGRTWDGGPQT
jgi:hypothetical protein